MKTNEVEPKKQKKQSKKAVVKTIQQDILTMDGITEDGILCTQKSFSKLYHLPEANFITEPDETQYVILENWVKILNTAPDKIDVTIAIINTAVTKEQVSHRYHLPVLDLATESLVEDYNRIVDAKLKESNSDIQKDKYILLSARVRELSEARQLLSTLELSLQEKIKATAGTALIPVDTMERIALMKSILNGQEGRIPFEREYGKYMEEELIDNQPKLRLNLQKVRKARLTIKDIIAPEMYEKSLTSVRLGENRICRSYIFSDYPPQMDTSFITGITNLPYESITLLRFRPIPKRQAQNLVKRMNVNVKADVQKETKRSYREGLDPSVTLSEDLLLAREEAAQLRNDVVTEGKKLFLTTLSTTLFAHDEDEMKKIAELFRQRAQDYSVNPTQLYGQQTVALKDALLLGRSEISTDRLLTSDNTRAIFPWNIQDIQDRQHGLFYGVNPVSGNAQMYNRRYQAVGNGLIFGHAGSGKSFFMKCEIMANYLSSDDDFIILDPENEFVPMTKALNGSVIELSNKEGTHINPFDMNMEWDSKDANPLTEKCDLAVSLVESILGHGRECNAYQVNAIHEAVEKMYQPYIDEMTKRRNSAADITAIPDIDTELCPTLVDFYNELCKMQTSEARALEQAVRPYCVGQYNLFAYKTNISLDARVTDFLLCNLPEKMKEFAMKVCLSYIWNRIVKNGQENRRLKRRHYVWAIMDEFHLCLQTESAATGFAAYYKRCRKFGGIMIGLTQDISDTLRTAQGQGIFSNSGTYVFFEQQALGLIKLQQLYPEMSEAMLDYCKGKGVGVGIMKTLTETVPINYRIPSDSLFYRIATTKPGE